MAEAMKELRFLKHVGYFMSPGVGTQSVLVFEDNEGEACAARAKTRDQLEVEPSMHATTS